jgi:hypothetical protein
MALILFSVKLFVKYAVVETIDDAIKVYTFSHSFHTYSFGKSIFII